MFGNTLIMALILHVSLTGYNILDWQLFPACILDNTALFSDILSVTRNFCQSNFEAFVENFPFSLIAFETFF